MIVLSEETETKTSICNVLLSCKSLLLFIYEIIDLLICKLSGKKSIHSKALASRRAPLKQGNVTGERNASGKRLKEIWEIPGPRPVPFFGTLFTSAALKSNNLMTANEEREKMYGTIVKEEHFWNFPLLMILGGEGIKKIAKTSQLIRPGMEISTLYRSTRPDLYSSYGLVNSQGEMWKKLHDSFNPITTSMKFVRSLLPVLNDIIGDAASLLACEATSNKEKLPVVLNSMIAEASFYTAFGMRTGIIGKEKKFPEKMTAFFKYHETYWSSFYKSIYGFPWWKYFPTKVWKDFIAAEDKMMSTISEITESLLESGEAGGVLGSVRDNKLSKSDLNVVLLELVTGATEPVYQTLIIIMYWVTKYEHIYKRIDEELREQLPTKDSMVDDNVLVNTPYLKACIMEAYRICPSACNVARLLEKEVEVDGYRLPAYTAVILQTWHACLQDSNFYRAKEYLPERWLFEDGVPPFRPHERQVMHYFGLGMRSCPGRKIAQQLIHTFLCKILRKFRVKFTKDINLTYEWLLVVKEPVNIELKEHET